MNIERLANALLLKNITISGDWVRASCPLAPWRHSDGKDTHPSFGLSLSSPHYNCFVCGGGSIEKLIQELEWRLGKPLVEAREILSGLEFDRLPDFESQEEHKVFQEWPEYFIDSFVPVAYVKRAVDYLQYRGFGLESAHKFDLRYDSKRDMIVFPYRNLYGRLSGARGRKIELPGDDISSLRHYDYTWNGVNNASLVWYNEHVLADDPQWVVIVEGQFDCLRVSEVYPYVVANMTARPVIHKMKKLLSSGVVIMTDNDLAGDEAASLYRKYFKSIGVACVIARPPKIFDTSGRLIKRDPDAMGVEWVRSQLCELGVI